MIRNFRPHERVSLGVVHQVENLAAAGVTDIVLAVNYRPEIMVAALKKVSTSSVWDES